MVCRAIAGDAPPIGATLEIGSGFSGYCVRTGFLQRCDDTETDHRVDRESCRLLGIRSIIAVPIRQGTFVIGLLEVFSSTAHAFNERDCTILQRLADIVLTAVDRGGRITIPVGTRPAKANGRSNAPISLFGSSGSLPSTPPSRQNRGNGGLRFPQRHLILLLIAAFSIAMVLAYLLSPWIVEKLHPTPRMSADSIEELPQSPAKPQVAAPVPELGLNEIRKRAELGDPYEQVALATRYATGEDVPQDYSMALRWFLKAAEQGHVGAQDTLGAYYWLGHGVRKDVTKAYFWSVLARASGKEASKVRVAFMSSQLTRAQAVAIQREANEFLKQHPPLMNSESSY
jgi:GAF domain/Sel1 repeat